MIGGKWGFVDTTTGVVAATFCTLLLNPLATAVLAVARAASTGGNFGGNFG